MKNKHTKCYCCKAPKEVIESAVCVADRLFNSWEIFKYEFLKSIKIKYEPRQKCRCGFNTMYTEIVKRKLDSDKLIKALEYCLKSNFEFDVCDKCPYDKLCDENPDAMPIDSLNLIKHQTEEIERLERINKSLLKDLQLTHDARIEDIKAVKSETIKRVCEELRREAFEDRLGFRIVVIDQISNLEEKMLSGLREKGDDVNE